MKKLFLTVTLIVNSCLANNYFYQENTNLTAKAINYHLTQLNLKNNLLTVKVNITNLSNQPVLINPDQWLLQDTKTKRPLKKNKTQLLLPQNLGQYQVDFNFSKSENLSLIITQNIIFNFKYSIFNEKEFQKFYPQSTVIIQENNNFFLDKSGQQYFLFTNNDPKQAVSEVYLVVPTQNIACTKIDFQHFVIKQHPQASHLIIYYYNSNKQIVPLTGLASYFPKDVQISHVIKDNWLNIQCLTKRNFQRVTAVINNQSYHLKKNQNGYFLSIDLKGKDFQKITVYLKQKDNLYSYLIDKFNRNP